MIQRYAIACMTLAAVATPQVALAFPLQVGTYQNNNRVIEIRSQGDRLCYQSFAGNRLVTASIVRDRDNDNFYRVRETEERLFQEDLGTILAGPIHNLQPYTVVNSPSATINPLLQACLNHRNDRFYEAVETVG